MTIRIAFILGQLRQGGAEQQIYHLLCNLDRSRFVPIIISLGPKPEEYWTRPIRDLDIPLWHFKRSLGRLGRTIQIARLLRQENIQIVHSWFYHTNFYASLAGRLSNVPVRLGSLRGSFKRLSRYTLVYWLGCWGVDAFITNSSVAASELLECRRPRAKIEVVPNGVAIPPEVSQDEVAQLKVELGFDKNDLLVGTIGRLDLNKNHQMLLKVFSKLTHKWDELRLVVIGDGPLKPQLLKEIETLRLSNKIRLPGALPHAAQYLPALEIVCLSSLNEGMPNMIMEALAAARPVVSTHCGSIGELVEHGRTGYVVPENDVEKMSWYIDSLLADPDMLCQMGNKGRKTMHDKFSINLMTSRMMKIYEQVFRERYKRFKKPKHFLSVST